MIRSKRMSRVLRAAFGGHGLIWLFLPALAMLAGCGSGPPPTFDLSAAHDFVGARHNHGELAIYEPSAGLPLASERIVMRTGPDAIAYLKGAQWADILPGLVQTRLIDSFENAHVLRAVGRPGLVANYSLQTEVRRFEMDVPNSQARVEISARIVSGDGHILTSKVFSAAAPAGSDDAVTVTAALDHALTKVLHQIVLWAAQKVADAQTYDSSIG